LLPTGRWMCSSRMRVARSKRRSISTGGRAHESDVARSCGMPAGSSRSRPPSPSSASKTSRRTCSKESGVTARGRHQIRRGVVARPTIRYRFTIGTSRRRIPLSVSSRGRREVTVESVAELSGCGRVGDSDETDRRVGLDGAPASRQGSSSAVVVGDAGAHRGSRHRIRSANRVRERRGDRRGDLPRPGDVAERQPRASSVS
jgi:hypothetical protein